MEVAWFVPFLAGKVTSARGGVGAEEQVWRRVENLSRNHLGTCRWR